MAWYELLRVGKFKTNKGKDVEFTKNDLESIATNYDSINFAAPLTIGHVKSDNDPAYGTVEKLKVMADKLCFKPGKVVAEFGKAVNKGLYNKVSAGLDILNGKYTLNHVAFLGAQKPAVDGLKPIENLLFSAPESVENIDMTNNIAPILSFGALDNNSNEQNEPDYKKLWKASEIAKNAIANELQLSKDEVQSLNCQLNTKSKDDAKTELSTYVDKQIEANKILPSEKPFVLKTLLTLGNLESDEFSGNYNTLELSSYKTSIENRQPHNLTNEVATNGSGGGGDHVKLNAVELAAHADKYISEMANKGIRVSNIEAVDFVQKNIEKFIDNK